MDAGSTANVSASVQDARFLQSPRGMPLGGQPVITNRVTFRAPPQNMSNSSYFDPQAQCLDTSLSANSEVGAMNPPVAVPAMMGVPPAASPIGPSGWPSSVIVSPMASAPVNPSAAMQEARIEALEARLLSMEAEDREKVAALRNALEVCISAIRQVEVPDEASSEDWQRTAQAMQSAAELGDSVLRATMLPSSSRSVSRSGMTRSSSSSGLPGRGRVGPATPVNVEVVGQFSAVGDQGRRARSGSPSRGPINAGQTFLCATPSGKTAAPQVFRDINTSSCSISVPSPAGPSPGQQLMGAPVGAVTPGRSVRQSPGGTPGQSVMPPFSGWGTGPGMQPPPGQFQSPPPMMSGVPPLPGGLPIDPQQLSNSMGPVPGGLPGPNGMLGASFPGTSGMPWLQPGSLPPPPQFAGMMPGSALGDPPLGPGMMMPNPYNLGVAQ